jgi:O-antigen ligase
MGAVSAVALLLLLLLANQSSLASWDIVAVLAVGGFLFTLLCIAVGFSGPSTANPGRTALRPALVVWWFLLISEFIFNRSEGTSQTALEGSFSVAAYDEAATWILASLAIFVICRLGHLRRIFSGPYKWMSLFGLCCVVSVVYAPRPMFSLAWALKLCLIILLLHVCASSLRDVNDIRAFFRATFWAFVLLTGAQLAQAFVGPTPAFMEGGRLGGSALSERAGVILLLSLTPIFSVGRKRIIPLVILSSVIMFLGGGKIAIFATLISGMLFFLLQRKPGSAVGFLTGLLVAGTLVVLLTPLSFYFRNYAESDMGLTFTGRTDLWAAALPEVYKSPIWGHGYMASKFVSVQIKETWQHWDATHLHNAYLEVLYNNGLVGITLLFAMSFGVLKKLIWVIKRTPIRDLYLLAVGSLAICTMLLINGLFNASIGGRPNSLFMLFLALVVLSEKLQESLAHYRQKAQMGV